MKQRISILGRTAGRLAGITAGLALIGGAAAALPSAVAAPAAPGAPATTVATATRTVSAKTPAAVRSASQVSLPRSCTVKGRVLCADKTRRKLYLVRDGHVLRTVDARFGCLGVRHTREGIFRVFRKSPHWVSTIYHTPMPYSMFFSGGQAVHYSSDFAARGYRGCSHGCINVRDMTSLKWIYAQVRVGDRVVVYRS